MGCSYAEMHGNPSTICRYWARELVKADVIVGTAGAHVIFPEGRHLNHTYMLARELNRSDLGTHDASAVDHKEFYRGVV